MKTTKIICWTLTIIFALLMLMDGISGIMQVEAGKEAMRHLGYPMYVLTIVGVAKVLGAIALVQTRFRTIKEWAYAGFAVNFIGASASRAFVGDGIMLLVLPIIMLTIMFIIYFLWMKVERNRSFA